MDNEGEESTPRRRRKSIIINMAIFCAFCSLGVIPVAGNGLGINYGMAASKLPSPTDVARIFRQSIPAVTRAKLYNTDSSVLSAFRDIGVSVVVGIGNEHVLSLADPAAAAEWLRQNVSAFLPQTLVSAIAVGNEVLTASSDNSSSPSNSELMEGLLLVMQNLQAAVIDQGLDGHVKISTPHSLGVLSTSYPPSAGAFRPDIASIYMKPLLDFLSQTGAPFMVNAYPYFAYKSDPDHISLEYALFRTNDGVEDPETGLRYTNLFDAQLDAVYSALQALGYPNLQLLVSETGWPSAGDSNEAGASPENAQAYVSNLAQRIEFGGGTPLRPNLTLDAYLFSLFNEDLKPGPTSERNYGLFYPNGTMVYSLASLGNSSNNSANSSIDDGQPNQSPFSIDIFPNNSSSSHSTPSVCGLSLFLASSLILGGVAVHELILQQEEKKKKKKKKKKRRTMCGLGPVPPYVRCYCGWPSVSMPTEPWCYCYSTLARNERCDKITAELRC